ncbi:MAG TPA: Ig-like domain-containing protein, partial [Acidimicrobiia bacterium]|nr:Ig-like domain-containing protein [Acidimicrobiia bacterium]
MQYREDRDEWQVLIPAVNIASDGTVEIPITEEGTYALVYADIAPHLARPATPVTGAALRGVAPQTPEVPLVAKSFTLDPPVVLPSGRTIATLKIEGTDPQTFPSGTAVQASIDEELQLADGSVITDPPFTTDLLLYRDLAGTTGVAQFHLAPSERATQVVLQSGADHIRIQPYPHRLERGTLIGPEGGRVPGDGEVTVEIPAGATSEPIHATATKIADPVQFGTIEGFTILAGFTLDLQPSIELQQPARATFNDLSQFSILNSQLVVVEVIDDTPYGRTFRLTALADAIPGDRATTRPIDRSVLPLDGIVRQGRYLLLAANQPVAFATGYVRLPGVRVSTPTLGVADLTRTNYLFALPVPAAQFTLIPRHTTTGDGAAYNHPAAPAAGEVVNVGELPLAAQPPFLVSTTPADGATDVSLGTNVQVTFSKDIASAEVSILNSQFSILNSSQTLAGPIVTLTPAEPLKPATRYTVTISPSTRATNGAPFGRAHSFSFTTVAQLANAEVRPERIRITIPDANGHSRVTGTAGALPAGWIGVAVRRGRDFVTRFQATAASDGSFTFLIAERVELTDRIDLQVINAAGAIAAILPLTPFSSEDGKSFVAQPDQESRYTTPDNIVVTVPAGAFDEPVVIRATPSQKDELDAIANLDAELNYSASIRLEFEGVARERLQVEIPAPQDADPARNYLLGWLGQSMRGPRLMIADTLRIENGRFTTTEPAQNALRTATSSLALRPSPHTTYTGSQVKS